MVDVFEAVAHPARRALLDELRDGPAMAGSLGSGLGISREAVSKHLRYMAESGLLVVEARGRERWPSNDDERVDGVVEHCEPSRQLVVTWQAPGEQVSRVTVALTAVEGGTELRLMHSGLRAPSSDSGHAAGWQVHVEQLVGGLEADAWGDRWATWAPLEAACRATLGD